MKKTNIVFALVASALCQFGMTPIAFAGDMPNILVMTEDSDENTIPRNSEVSKRVFSAMNDEMVAHGYGVYDETAVTMGKFELHRQRRSDEELIDIARSVKRPPIDVITTYEIFASAKELDYTTKVRARISGRLLEAQSGRRLGNFELESPAPWNAPKDCNRECIIKSVGDHAKLLGRDLASALSEKLDWMIEGRDRSAHEVRGVSSDSDLLREFTLTFDGFTTNDMLSVEEYLVVFSGYKSHRPISESMRHHEIWYESRIGTARLKRNFAKMAEEMGISMSIQFEGNKFVIKKISRRGEHHHPSKGNW